MPRASDPVDDRTPIAGPRLDVAARIGWLLRTHRTVAGVSLRDMSAALGEHGVRLSPATLSRIESEGHRSAPALDGYAVVLGLADGFLRTHADHLCHTFRDVPAEHGAAAVTLESFSRACEAVAGGDPTGADWVELARQHAVAGGFGLPAGPMRDHLDRLVDELARATGHARLSRYLALGTLRSSAYADVAHAAVRDVVDDPDAQRFWDALDSLGTRPDEAVLTWAVGLLADPSTYRVLGATYLVQSMLVRGGLPLPCWESAVPGLAAAWRAAGDEPARRAALAKLCHALPDALWERLVALVAVDPAPPPAPRDWSRHRGNPHYALAAEVAADACTRLAHREEPLLARLVFEALFDPRGVRRSAASWLLAGSPFGLTVGQVLLERRDGFPDRALRLAALTTAACCAAEPPPEHLLPLRSDDPVQLDLALAFASLGDDPLPGEVVEHGLAGDELLVRRTLSVLGLQSDAGRLTALARDNGRPAWVRGAARWWWAGRGRVRR